MVFEIPLNEQDKLFYSLECMGPPPVERVNFTLEGGAVDIELLRSACHIELERYPIFNSVIEERSSGRKWNLCWVPRRDSIENQMVTEHDFSNLPTREAVKKFRQILFDPFNGYNSFKQSPLKIILCKLPDNQYKLIMFFHHASVDLAGVSSFVRDLFDTFNKLAQNLPTEKNPENTPIPATPQILPQTFVNKLCGLFQALAVVVRLMIKQKGRRVATLASGNMLPDGSTLAVMRAIPVERVEKYMEVSKKSEITFNSFLVAAHGEALYRWKARHKEICRTVRAQVHQDLRKTKEEFNKFGNKFSPFVVMIHEEDRLDMPGLLRNVHEQTLQAKKNHVAEKLMNFLWIFQYTFAKKLLSLCARFLNKPANPMFGDSFTISNCGRIWAGPDGKTYLTHLGDSMVTECFMPGFPVPSIGVFTSFSTFRGKLCLSFSYYKWVLSEEDANMFVDLLEQTMDEMADIALLRLQSNN